MPDGDAAPPAPMLPEALQAALERLAGALDRLQAAAERRATAQAARIDRDDELMIMQDDRARLAGDLDAALSVTERLRAANAAALARLGRAEASIEAVMQDLARDEGAEAPPIEEAS